MASASKDDARTAIDQALSLAATLCPDAADQLSSYNFYNGVIVQNMTSEFPTMMCAVARLLVKGNNINSVVLNAYWYITAVGIVSCSLSLAILCNRKCKEVTFAYHRAINAFDMIGLLMVFESALFNTLRSTSATNWFWQCFHWVFTTRLENVMADTVETLVAWIATERALCYFPSIFTKINAKKLAYRILAAVMLVAFALNLPFEFQYNLTINDANGQYTRVTSTFGASSGFLTYQWIYNVVVLIRAVAVSVGTGCTMVVFVLIGRKKRRLARCVGPQSVTAANLINQAKRNQIFCLLQLCEALPLVAKCVLLLATQSLTFNVSYDMFAQLPYDDAVRLLRTVTINMNLFIAKRVVAQLVRASHFFLYMLLLRKFRAIAYDIMRKMVGVKNSVMSNAPLVSFNGPQANRFVVSSAP